VHPGEELNIFYGHKLWFDPVGTNAPQPSIEQESEDGWGGLSAMDDTDSGSRQNGTVINNNEDAVWSSLIDRWDANPDTIIAEVDLPFTRIKIMPDDPEEEVPETVQTGNFLIIVRVLASLKAD
jgi:tRNA-specific adenosine deaminase 3